MPDLEHVAGDTDMTPDNQDIKCDVALIPVGGKYTMDCKEAANLVNRMKPKPAIPTHYGTVVGSHEDGKRFAELVDSRIEVRGMMYKPERKRIWWKRSRSDSW